MLHFEDEEGAHYNGEEECAGGEEVERCGVDSMAVMFPSSCSPFPITRRCATLPAPRASVFYSTYSR